MRNNFYKKLVHNMSSPLLLGHDNNNSNNSNYLSLKSDFKNIKLNFNKKLSPLKTSNKIMLKKITLSKKIFNPTILRSRNKKTASKSCNLELSGEIANANANKMMKKYFYPDFEKEQEKDQENANKLNEELDINKMLTFYSRLKYKREREEVKRMINKQKKITIFTNETSNNNTLISPSSVKTGKSHLKRTYQLDSNTSYVTDKNNSRISMNNFITLDIHKKIYNDPLHSLDTMKKNKLIYNSVIDDYNINRLNSFKKLENELRPLLNIHFELSPSNQKNIKVLPYIPRLMAPNLIMKEDESDNPNTKTGTKNLDEEMNILNEAMPLYFSKFFQTRRRGDKFLLRMTNLYAAKNSPESRSQFIFVQDGKDIILHGGYNISRKNNLWRFDPFEKSWTSIEPVGLMNELRYAHSGVLYHRHLYIFGGKYFKGVNLADIEIFNLDKKCWIFPKLESEKRIPLRRNHVSCAVGNTMFVHGGFTEDNTYLDDMYILNYKPLKWYDIDIINTEAKIPPLAHHSCCLVMPEVILLNPKFNIYSMPELGERTKLGQIKEKGIYIFGGKISNEGPINNNLYVIKVGIKPLEIIILKTTGIQPIPRYDCSLNFYEKGNMLIVHGGRSNKREFENGLNDTFILDLYYLGWTKVEYFNNKYIVPPKYFHQSIVFGGNLFIFGGMNGNNYIGSELEVLDLNSNSKCLKEKNILENQKKKAEEEKRKSNNKVKRYPSINKPINKQITKKFSFLNLIKKVAEK